jgi:hypothetical protein
MKRKLNIAGAFSGEMLRVYRGHNNKNHYNGIHFLFTFIGFSVCYDFELQLWVMPSTQVDCPAVHQIKKKGMLMENKLVLCSSCSPVRVQLLIF